jgi:LacI family transcriptional regulator
VSVVTLKQLAQQLGLASSTVSRALRNGSDISADTKQRVQAMAAQLHYQPHAYASGLRNQLSHTIGVVVPEVNDRFFSLAIDGIEEMARQNGYHTLICLTHDSYALEADVTRQLTRGRVDGVLLSLAGETQGPTHLEQLCSRGVPLVFFDRVSEAFGTATVTTNDFDAAYQATEHLLTAGCRRVAYLLMSSQLSIGNRRQQGYRPPCTHTAYPSTTTSSWKAAARTTKTRPASRHCYCAGPTSTACLPPPGGWRSAPTRPAKSWAALFRRT